MKLKQIGPNRVEIHQDNGVIVLVSYETPVACMLLGPHGYAYIKTAKKYSRTTSKHISEWLPLKEKYKVINDEVFREILVAGKYLFND